MAAYQGTLATIRDEVIALLHLDADVDEAQVDEQVNLAQQDAVMETGCLQQDGSATLTSGQSSYDLPATVAWIKSLTLTYSDGSVTDPLRQVPLDTILSLRRANVAAGSAVVTPLYAISGQNLLDLWPQPGAGQSMAFRYVYLPDELTADGDEPAIMEPYGSKLLTYGAAVELARFKKDPLLPDLEAQYGRWLAKFQVWLNRREGNGPLTFRVRQPDRAPIRFANASVDLG